MSRLYIANLTKQNHLFSYQKPEYGLANTVIGYGRQELIGTDMTPEQIDAIVKQHAPYGLVKFQDLKRTRGFVGMCYSIDKPVPLEAFHEQYERNDEEMNATAGERRRETLEALSTTMQSMGPDLAVRRVEAEQIEESKDGTPKIAEGLERPSEGVAPRHAEGKTAERRARK